MDLNSSLRRTNRWMAGCAAAGGVGAWHLGGWRWAVSFFLGAGAAWLGYRSLRTVVLAIGETAPARAPRLRYAVLVGLRYLLLGAGAYVIVEYSPLHLPAALAGLFVPVAGIIFEILYELIYGATS